MAWQPRRHLAYISAPVAMKNYVQISTTDNNIYTLKQGEKFNPQIRQGQTQYAEHLSHLAYL